MSAKIIQWVGIVYYSWFAYVTALAWRKYDLTIWYEEALLTPSYLNFYMPESIVARILHRLYLPAIALLPILYSFIILGIADEAPSILFLVILLVRAILVGVYTIHEIGTGIGSFRPISEDSGSLDDIESDTV